jgi:ketosteroid isomerase-like protein
VPTEQDVEAVAAIFDAFNRRDRETMKELVTEDVEVVPLRAVLERTSYRGPNAVDEFWTAVDESWSEISIEVTEIRQGEKAVLVLGRLRGVGREAGVPAELDTSWVVETRAGKLARLAIQIDIDEARRLAGVED